MIAAGSNATIERREDRKESRTRHVHSKKPDYSVIGKRSVHHFGAAAPHKTASRSQEAGLAFL